VTLYYLGNARYPDQAEQMRRLEEAGVCIFCPGHVDAPDDPHVVLTTQDWVVRHNAYPYAGTKLHLLLVPRRHVPDLLDLTDAELAGFWQVGRQLRERYGLPFYGLGARCGDCRYTGGTIEHVHVHLVVGDVESAEYSPVRLKLSSRPASTGAQTPG
jgi:diadenosine tetraphosphate (Ap4A) HIT family hydrolase